MCYPNKIKDTGTQCAIDVDEVAVSADGSNRTHVSALIDQRVKKVGPCSKSIKVSLLLAIGGNIYSLIFIVLIKIF